MILCAGECLIDMLPRKSVAAEDAFAPYAGGAVFNTAIALGRLGAPAGFFSGLSTDLFGKVLEDALTASGVDSSFAARSDRPTTLAFVKLTDGHASYAFYDENTAGRMLAEADLPRLGDEVQALFFGGISLAVEPCGATYEALMAREGGHRATMIDPNIRPSFIRDEARYRARILRMIGLADIVKVSDEDLAWLVGEGPVADKVQEVRDLGPALVFVTEGAQGVTGHFAGGEVFVAAHKVEVVDTVGAGDTFNAGALAALHERGVLSRDRIRSITREDIEAAATLGVRAAAVTVGRAGANPPWRSEL